MPLISTFAALSTKGYGGGGSPIFAGGGWIGVQDTTGSNLDNIIDSSGNNFYLIPLSNTATALVKTDYLGSVQFFKSIPAYLRTIQLDNSGNIYLGGVQTGNTSGAYAYLAKLNSSGSLTWAKTLTAIGGSSMVISIDIDVTANIIFAYYQTPTVSGYTIVDSNGTGISNVIYSQIGYNTIFKGIRNPSGNIWVLYGNLVTTIPPGVGFGRGITCRNISETELFNYEPNTGLTGSVITDFITDSSANVYVASVGYDTATTISYLIITKINISGVVQWTVAKTYPAASAVSNPRLAIDNLGSLYISYSFTPSNKSFIDAISTSAGVQLFSNYFTVNGSAILIRDLNFYSDQLIITTSSKDILNVPANGKIPFNGNYVNGARTYVYYPTFDAGYTAVSVATNAQTSGNSTGSFTTTTVTPTITDLGNTISVIVIGSGI